MFYNRYRTFIGIYNGQRRTQPIEKWVLKVSWDQDKKG